MRLSYLWLVFSDTVLCVVGALAQFVWCCDLFFGIAALQCWTERDQPCIELSALVVRRIECVPTFAPLKTGV